MWLQSGGYPFTLTLKQSSFMQGPLKGVLFTIAVLFSVQFTLCFQNTFLNPSVFEGSVFEFCVWLKPNVVLTQSVNRCFFLVNSYNWGSKDLFLRLTIFSRILTWVELLVCRMSVCRAALTKHLDRFYWFVCNEFSLI